MQSHEVVSRPRQFSLYGRMAHFLTQPTDHDVTILLGLPLMIATGAILGLINVLAVIHLVAALLGS
jgi:hypothetical protein